MRALIGEGRKDESGDFTKGAGLSEEQVEMVENFLTIGRAGFNTEFAWAEPNLRKKFASGVSGEYAG